MNTRNATQAENQEFKRFERAIVKGRKQVSAYLGLTGCLALAEQWRQAEVKNGTLSPGAFPPLFTAGQVEAARAVANNWNQLEDALTGLQTQRFGMRLTKGDIDIIELDQAQEQNGLGFPVLVVVAIGAGVLIAGAIALAVRWGTEAEREAVKLNQRILELNARMAEKPKAVRESWRRLQKTAPWQQQHSFWDQLKGAATGIAALAVGGLVLWGAYQGQKAIKRRKRRIENPCGGGSAISDPYSWAVNWSQDPQAIRRQLDHVIDNLGNKKAESYRDFFDPLLDLADAAEIGGDLDAIDEIEAFDYDEEIPF